MQTYTTGNEKLDAAIRAKRIERQQQAMQQKNTDAEILSMPRPLLTLIAHYEQMVAKYREIPGKPAALVAGLLQADINAAYKAIEEKNILKMHQHFLLLSKKM